MKRLLTILSVVLALAIGSMAQTSSHTAFRVRFGAVLPATCNPATGDIFWKNVAPIGIYQCLVANTWTAGVALGPMVNVDANTVAQANGANGQTLYVYRTVDNVLSPTNYERLVMQWNAGQVNFRIGPEAGGTGTLRSLDINSGGSLGVLSSAGGRVFIIGNTGLITQYGNAATVAQGVAPIRGTQSLTAQNAAIGATNVLAAAAAGLYRVCYNAATTTSGTGTTATVSVIWTDVGGVKTFTSATFSLAAVDVTGQVNGCQVIRSAAAANIQVSTAGTFGTSVYRLDATAEAVQ